MQKADEEGGLVTCDLVRQGGMTAKRYQEQVLNGLLHDFYQEMSEK